ncbi:MAG: phosphoribosylamine--glycine ligase [SAR324 cluster bacterium]|jgi:phosphoribosylamine--glycine ligase|nr:phosphoribosylamine--glycine ligase [Deltaproteobacteria bacterium]MDP6092571.1 phosphoribosylamine--glycine ligase [SAR324 cluster bacterium]MBP45077.1 phosphoribosylamine--glycine ligase [Deltaproteobacteria bacterium]MDP6248643.1 phosphoribosylamine--glycine ligase [SAR324 cluster bacterium]MDP6462371.1 phosphoribosylamine--glycine ligase [SAR324 cluster bacterium]|tara:strand:+ start:194 stop:1450 length:1257 start_codon:yes stop_codon:yes gene_type:complete
MKILVVGGGGREHTLVWKLNQSPIAEKIFCAPGNPGIADLAECVPLKVNQLEELANFAESQQIGLTVVGPEEPLVLGIVDEFKRRGLKVYGPDRQSALLEGSKAHAKAVMERHGIPTAKFQEFTHFGEALEYIREKGAPLVIKADGLAAGKGVTVADTLEEAEAALDDSLRQSVFGEAGQKVVVEEFLQGEEMTVLAFVDGETVLPLVPSQDHKPIFDGDRGPNTGGMGAYSPVPHLEQWLPEIHRQILKPLANGLVAEGHPFRGLLYTGLMLDESGPKVVEFNVRFGDPEAQVVLPLLENDLLEILLASCDGRLAEMELKWKAQASVCVIAAAPGYPGPPTKGLAIELPENSEIGTQIFQAGTRLQEETLVTSGGRVLGVTAQAEDIEQARNRAYKLMKEIKFKGKQYRTDIGAKAL